jgi:hypothetical protein
VGRQFGITLLILQRSLDFPLSGFELHSPAPALGISIPAVPQTLFFADRQPKKH